MSEIWKSIPGFDGRYEASNMGRVRATWTTANKQAWLARTGGVLKPRCCKDGYLEVVLTKDLVKRSFRVSRVVLMAFTGEPAPGVQACHNSGIPTDNRIENLRWDTAKANHHDRHAHGTAFTGERNPLAKLTWDQVRVIRSSPESQSVLGKAFGVSSSAISEVQRHTVWKESAD